VNVTSIYQHFGIPKNLQEHMQRVASVANVIMEGWLSKNLDKKIIVKAALVHDLANIVKFALEDGSPLKSKQLETITKYGSDDHLATELMLKELGVSDEIIELVQNKSFGNAIKVEQSQSWPLKILFYADMRVIPTGIVNLNTRLKDVTTRLEKYRNHPQKEQLITATKKIEVQIQSQTKTDLSRINNEIINNHVAALLNTNI
jgi:hypothetical protein